VRFATASLRTKLVLIFLFGALAPFGAVGVWLASNTQRSAEQSLKNRLDTTLVRAAQDVGSHWVVYRSAILDVSEDTALHRALLASTVPSQPIALTRRPAFERVRAGTQIVLVRDRHGAPRWALTVDAAGEPVLVAAADSLRVMTTTEPDVITITMAVRRPERRETIGVVEARIHASALLSGSVGAVAGSGAVVGLVDRTSGATIAPFPIDAALFRRDRFTWGGEEWATATRALSDPDVEIVVAAPIAAYMVPFDRASRTGIIALALVAVVGFLLVTMLTRRVTRSLVELADAADAVAAGDLDRRVESRSGGEVGRVAVAFNTMTESLRRTLAQLSQRQAVAAVGEFASALAHEIRNPLSAMQLNLQHVEERLGDDTRLREPVGNALRDIARLENTVAGALRLARTGTMAMDTVSIGAVLSGAARAAGPAARDKGIAIEPTSRESSEAQVRGNAAALEQLFLNLLLNAVEATPTGGRVGVEVDRANGTVCVNVWDTGSGLSTEANTRAFEPFFTTKAEGTGLGLSVAKRIATAHAGRIELSPSGRGTDARVFIPALPA
jgi:two-component system sensor histidine kinase AtoS